jgi:hypothetical protein
MAQVTFEIDPATEDALEELKAFFNVKTRSAAIRNAIALARVVRPAAKDQRVVVRDLNSSNGEKDLTIVLPR